MPESPIALTNTFAVGTIATAMIRHAVAANSAIGRTSPTLNPVVAECNDGWLNDLHAFAVGDAHYGLAYEAATTDFAQGAVGARRGMSGFELKGGIGSASRRTIATSVGSATEQAIIHALFAAETVEGRDGQVRTSITKRLPDWRTRLPPQ